MKRHATQTPPNAKDEHDLATNDFKPLEFVRRDPTSRTYAGWCRRSAVQLYASRRNRVATTCSPRLRHDAATAQRPLNIPRRAAMFPSPPFDPPSHRSTTTHDQKITRTRARNLQFHDRRPRARRKKTPPSMIIRTVSAVFDF